MGGVNRTQAIGMQVTGEHAVNLHETNSNEHASTDALAQAPTQDARPLTTQENAWALLGFQAELWDRLDSEL